MDREAKAGEYKVIVRITMPDFTISVVLDPGTKEHQLQILDNGNTSHVLHRKVTEDDIANIAAGFKNAFNILDGGLE